MKFTSYYWLGKEVCRTVFEAGSEKAAREEHEQLGWNAYDERRLFRGEVEVAADARDVVQPNN